MQFELSPNLSELLKSDLFIKTVSNDCKFIPEKDVALMARAKTDPLIVINNREMFLKFHSDDVPSEIFYPFSHVLQELTQKDDGLRLDEFQTGTVVGSILMWAYEHHLREKSDQTTILIRTYPPAGGEITIRFWFVNAYIIPGQAGGTIAYLSLGHTPFTEAFLLSESKFEGGEHNVHHQGTISTKNRIGQDTVARDVAYANNRGYAITSNNEPDQLDDGLPIYLSEWVAQYVLSDLVNTTEINGRSGNTVDLDTKHVALLLDTILTDEDRSELKEHLGFLWATCDRVGQSVKRSLGNDVHVVARGHSMSLEEKVVQSRNVINRTKRAGLRDYSGVRSSRG